MDLAVERGLRRAARLALGALLGKRLPILSGALAVPGVDGSITIHRDGFGVPHIRANTDHDAFFGLGFCHGQDRAGQLELTLRTVRGTLSEVIGKDGLAVDRLSRRIGFRRAAVAQLPTMRPQVRLQLEAYAEGIAAGTTHGSKARAHELVFLGCESSRWEAADVQAVSVLLCFALAANWDVELLRYEILQRDGRDALLALDAPYPGDMPAAKTPLRPAHARGASGSGGELLADLEALRAVFPLGAASNAWAVAGSKSATKRPLLAADPHLPPDIPVHWYLAHMATPEWRATGACFVGIPGIAIGHNEHAAWGVTAAHADNTDFFIEEIGADKQSVRQGDRFVACEVRKETIRVKGQPDVVEEILVTPRGPIVGKALAGPGEALSISATWLAARPYTGLFLAHRVKSRQDFHDLFREASTSSVNVVYADKDGSIMWRLGVDVPIRKRGHGTMPQPGWEAGAGWEDALVPFESMPFVDDPAEGFVASANNAPLERGLAGEAAHFFGIDFLDGYRQRVIADALGSRDDWTLEAMQALQRDTRSIPWEQVKDAVLGLDVSDADAVVAKNLLLGWNGHMSESSAAASIWALFACRMMARVVRAKAPNTAGRALGAGFHEALPHNTMITRRMSHLCRLLREQPAGFFKEGWPNACERALADAARTLSGRHGKDPLDWAWGTARPLRFLHPMAKAVPPLDYALGEGPVPFAGDASTLQQGTLDLVEPLSNPLATPNLRVVIDVGGWENSRFALIAGQSQNPFSLHHFDHHDAWRAGGLAIAWTEQAARETAQHTLTLEGRS